MSNDIRVFIARHGQPAIEGLSPGMDHELPPGDPPLTELGREQAALLGRHLRESGFKGRVLASPYARTAETASVVCGECRLEFYPEPAIQEIRFRDEKPHEGLTLNELSDRFAHLAADAVLEYPWMVEGAETSEDVWERVKVYGDKLEIVDDTLFICHGATVNALKKYFASLTGEPLEDRFNWNCALSCFVRSDGLWRAEKISDYGFIPEEMVTSNMTKFGEAAD